MPMKLPILVGGVCQINNFKLVLSFWFAKEISNINIIGNEKVKIIYLLIILFITL